jgi:ketosteroid isomerase-like protein
MRRPAQATRPADPSDVARANEAMIRAFYDARANHQPLEAFLTPDVVWEVPGANRISGSYRGPDELRRYIALRQELADGTFAIDVHDVIAGTMAATMFSTARAVRREATFASAGVALFDIRDGRIARCRLFPVDQNAFDTFWS